jgi:AraC-like DNA-binding protein
MRPDQKVVGRMIEQGRGDLAHSAFRTSSIMVDRFPADVRLWPGMRSEYSFIPAGGGAGRTESHQVGVSFSSHRGAVYESAGRTVEADIVAGAVVVTGREAISWLRVREATEALEIFPDPSLLRSLATALPEFEPALTWDGTVLAIGAILQQVHAGGSALSDIAASTLAHRLASHLLQHYSPSPQRQRSPVPSLGRLDRGTVDRVTQFVDAELANELTLERLAAVAARSPFHFARSFKAATGMAPHQFVMARRVHRAKALLRQPTLSVPDIARSVGLSNVSHFRRVFRRHTGVLPGELRKNSKFGPSMWRDGVWSSYMW